MLILVKILMSIVFVAAGGAVFTEWGRKHKILTAMAGFVAIVGAAYLFSDIYNDLVGDVKNELSQEYKRDILKRISEEELKKVQEKKEQIKKEERRLQQRRIEKEEQSKILFQKEKRQLEILKKEEIIREKKIIEKTRNNKLNGPKVFEPDVVFITGNSFWMGCAHKNECKNNEKPRFKTRVNDFYMSKYETTFAQWNACVKDSGCSYKPKSAGWGHGERPVVFVSWNDANKFAHWMSKKTGKIWRLPTEAEWEYAARGDVEGKNQSRYSWGNHISTKLANYDYGKNCQTTACGKQNGTREVGSYKPNGFGLYDMHGNVWEWVSGHIVPYPVSDWEKVKSDSWAVFRGGGWYHGGENLRASFRAQGTHEFNEFHLGFRLVR